MSKLLSLNPADVEYLEKLHNDGKSLNKTHLADIFKKIKNCIVGYGAKTDNDIILCSSFLNLLSEKYIFTQKYVEEIACKNVWKNGPECRTKWLKNVVNSSNIKLDYNHYKYFGRHYFNICHPNTLSINTIMCIILFDGSLTIPQIFKLFDKYQYIVPEENYSEFIRHMTEFVINQNNIKENTQDMQNLVILIVNFLPKPAKTLECLIGSSQCAKFIKVINFDDYVKSGILTTASQLLTHVKNKIFISPCLDICEKYDISIDLDSVIHMLGFAENINSYGIPVYIEKLYVDGKIKSFACFNKLFTDRDKKKNYFYSLPKIMFDLVILCDKLGIGLDIEMLGSLSHKTKNLSVDNNENTNDENDESENENYRTIIKMFYADNKNIKSDILDNLINAACLYHDEILYFSIVDMYTHNDPKTTNLSVVYSQKHLISLLYDSEIDDVSKPILIHLLNQKISPIFLSQGGHFLSKDEIEILIAYGLEINPTIINEMISAECNYDFATNGFIDQKTFLKYCVDNRFCPDGPIQKKYDMYFSLFDFSSKIKYKSTTEKSKCVIEKITNHPDDYPVSIWMYDNAVKYELQELIDYLENTHGIKPNIGAFLNDVHMPQFKNYYIKKLENAYALPCEAIETIIPK